MAYVGKHFRTEEPETAALGRRLFLKRSLAAATGLVGFVVLDAANKPNATSDAYGSAPYGGSA